MRVRTAPCLSSWVVQRHGRALYPQPGSCTGSADLSVSPPCTLTPVHTHSPYLYHLLYRSALPPFALHISDSHRLPAICESYDGRRIGLMAVVHKITMAKHWRMRRRRCMLPTLMTNKSSNHQAASSAALCETTQQLDKFLF